MFKNIRIIHDKKSNTYDIEFMLFEQHFARTFSRREVAEEFYNKILQVERETDSTNKGAKEVCPECGSNNVGLLADWKTRVCFECKHNWHTGRT